MTATSFPEWARARLLEAVRVAHRPRPRPGSLAIDLYRQWFAPVTDAVRPEPVTALAGRYRRAHAAGCRSYLVDGMRVLERCDAIGPDGWWRTWNAGWVPVRRRSPAVRVMLSPRPAQAMELVTVLTGALEDVPHLLALPTDAARLARSGAALLCLPDLAALSALRPLLDPLLRPDVPALCLPLAPGIATAEFPANGMTFGEHRCHLVALALDRAGDDPLADIAAVFGAHGVDPAAPHLSRR